LDVIEVTADPVSFLIKNPHKIKIFPDTDDFGFPIGFTQ